MGLFNRLLKLHASPKPTEDFFTEIVAYLLSSSDELVFNWLADLALMDAKDYTAVAVLTQVRFEGDQPDILIKLYDDDGEDWVLIESKLGASEGPNQLRRYARTLDQQKHVREKHLLFITRDYEPKDPARILANIPAGSVNFWQLRWLHFYNFLRSQPQNELVKETHIFMKEKRMGQANQFDSASLLSISGIPTVLSLMESTLDDEVKSRLGAVIGTVKFSGLDNLKVRYVLQRNILLNPTWYIGLGYYYSGINIGEYPTIRLNLGASTNVRNKNPEVLKLLQSIAERDGWAKWSVDYWFTAYRERNLQEFLVAGDHVAAVKGQFIEFIDELAEIKAAHPEVPW